MAIPQPLDTEPVPGSTRPVSYHLAETHDGLYTPYALRTPDDEGEFPFVFLAYGNGGGGVPWLRERVRTHGYIMDRLLAAGYACAWGRYRSEVELGFHRGGPLVVDRRQGMDLMNRSPLEYEDELAIIQHVKQHPQVDATASATSASATPARCCSSWPRSTTASSRPASPANRPTTSSST